MTNNLDEGREHHGERDNPLVHRQPALFSDIECTENYSILEMAKFSLLNEKVVCFPVFNAGGNSGRRVT